MKQKNVKRYCPNGHIVEDEQLNYCPECGMPLYTTGNNPDLHHQQYDAYEKKPAKKSNIKNKLIAILGIFIVAEAVIVCHLYIKGSIVYPPPTNPPITQPPVTLPPVTQPPVTQPPVTQPPVTQPPVTQPPITQPPVTQPPVTQPPVTQPPVTQPPKKDLTYIYFSGNYFSKNKKFHVYSAPSTTSWYTKAKNGDPVYASTNDIIYVAGYDGNWLLIRYETSKGSYRMGYTSEASGNFNNLSFNYYSGSITSDCSITDGMNSIGISRGTSVTVLGKMDTGIYIEAYINGQQARGIAPESCVSW